LTFSLAVFPLFPDPLVDLLPLVETLSGEPGVSTDPVITWGCFDSLEASEGESESDEAEDQKVW
jgi:hypothetical protein